MKDIRYDQFSAVPPLTPVTKWLIIVSVIVYFVDFAMTHLGIQFGSLGLVDIFGLTPASVLGGWIWQPVTYLFLHGNPLHLLLNMLILWYFGAEIEMRFGTRRFLFYFFLCGIGAGLFNLGVNWVFANPIRMQSPIVGSSGAIYGILAAYGLLFKDRYFLVFFLFPMKAKYFVLVMAAIELVMGVDSGGRDNVAHFAHLGGMGIGALYTYFTFFHGGGRKGRGDRERLKKQFTLIVNQKPQPGETKNGGPYWN